ncbi:MAG: hypothetical protein IJC28_02830, partial [Mailhella sp.]|nr:hypothetical protein [Mailhella sp.]
MKKLRLLLFSAVMALSLTACVPADFDPVQWMTSTVATTNTSYDDSSAYSGLPRNYSEFRDRCQSACQSPYGAAKMYFDAVFCYMDKAKRSEASKMIRFIMHADAGWERSPYYSIFVERLRSKKHHHIFRSFAEGTSPENDYSMDPGNYRLMMGEIVEEQGYLRLFLYSSGSDSARPIWVKQFDDGLWYVINNAGTYSGVREPYSAKNHYGHDASYDRY